MTTQTDGGARVYRWEAVPPWSGDATRYALRTDNDRGLHAACRAHYLRAVDGEWAWMLAGTGRYQREPTEAAARRACLLAVLHAPDADEPGEARR